MFRPHHQNMFKTNTFIGNGIRPMPPNFHQRPNPGVHWNNQEPNRCGRWPAKSGDELWCETCDRGFPTSDQLEKHRLQHQKCNIDGCQFVAHPKVITKHIQMQHSTGLYKKIGKLDNPEAINKWREERKKKYPTQQNIDKKTAELKEKEDRGEKMCLRPDRIKRNANSVPGRGQSKYNNNHRQHQANFKRNNLIGIAKKPKKDVKSVPNVDMKSKLEPFTGIQNIMMDCDVEELEEESQCNFFIENDDCEAPTHNVSKSENNTHLGQTGNKIRGEPICSALSSLINEYGSSDEELNTELTRTTESFQLTKELDSVHKDINTTNKIINNDKPNINEDSGPEEEKVIRNNTLIDDKINQCDTRDKNTHGKLKYRKQSVCRGKALKSKPKLPSTLLHKLLFNEMRQERNLVLQCIRYIKNKKFFEQ